jgi:hypothetical protein
MHISQLKQYEVYTAISVITMYCKVYNVPTKEVPRPSLQHRTSGQDKISGVQLQSTFHFIQHKWLESVTSHPWSTDEFIRLSFQVAEWIEESPEVCEEESEWEYFWATMWKRGAEWVLGLRTVIE